MRPRFYQGNKVSETVECKCPRCERRYTRLLFYTGYRPMRAYCSDCTEQLFVLNRPVEDIYSVNLHKLAEDGG